MDPRLLCATKSGSSHSVAWQGSAGRVAMDRPLSGRRSPQPWQWWRPQAREGRGAAAGSLQGSRPQAAQEQEPRSKAARTGRSNRREDAPRREDEAAGAMEEGSPLPPPRGEPRCRSVERWQAMASAVRRASSRAACAEAGRAAAERAEDARRLEPARAEEAESTGNAGASMPGDRSPSPTTSGSPTQPDSPDPSPASEISESRPPSPAREISDTSPAGSARQEGEACDWSPDEVAGNVGSVPTADAIAGTLDAIAEPLDALDGAEAEEREAAVVGAAHFGPASSQDSEAAAGASAAVCPRRRQALMSHLVVEQRAGSLRCYPVLSPGERAPIIERVLRARVEAAKAEARELGVDASTPGEALKSVIGAGRAIVAPRAADGCRYVVFDAALARRSKYFYPAEWSQSPDGYYWLHVQDRRAGGWQPVALAAPSGPPVISRAARPICKTHCDRTFGGEVWFNVLIQTGGCPAEFVDAYNDAVGRRLQAVDLPPLDAAAPGARRRDAPDPARERPSFLKREAARLLIAASASTPGGRAEDDRLEAERLRNEAGELTRRRLALQADSARAVRRPATGYTAEASGAEQGEPIAHFPRALLHALLALGVEHDLAANLVDPGRGKGGGKGYRGKGGK
ncbi:unnamed protein product [Prorocentrum cordatum]|uniref:Uncharacterized protein n=1 Tax=Prorocentrum cordatum TaxID=2364126 RepID=A0ABN9QSZ6_9DINO|nr:unnamed protein product [Polarella glacialis]